MKRTFGHGKANFCTNMQLNLETAKTNKRIPKTNEQNDKHENTWFKGQPMQQLQSTTYEHCFEHGKSRPEEHIFRKGHLNPLFNKIIS